MLFDKRLALVVLLPLANGCDGPSAADASMDDAGSDESDSGTRVDSGSAAADTGAAIDAGPQTDAWSPFMTMPDASTACTPDETAPCDCPGGAVGRTTCGATGMFGECMCPEPTCVPGQMRACTCGGTQAGSQTCQPDGINYTTCDCEMTCTTGTCACTLAHTSGMDAVDSCRGEQLCLCEANAASCMTGGICFDVPAARYRVHVGRMFSASRPTPSTCWDTPGCETPDLYARIIRRTTSDTTILSTMPGDNAIMWNANETSAPFMLAAGDRLVIQIFDDDVAFDDEVSPEMITTVSAAQLRARHLEGPPSGATYGVEVELLPERP